MDFEEQNWLKGVGEKLNEARVKRGFSIQMLADSSNFDRATLSNILNKGQNTTLSTIFKLCKILEIDPSQIINFEEDN